MFFLKRLYVHFLLIFLVQFVFYGCKPSREEANLEMVTALTTLAKEAKVPSNFFANHLRFRHFDSLRKANKDHPDLWLTAAKEAIRAGKNEEAIKILKEAIAKDQPVFTPYHDDFHHLLGLAYLRKGEIDNCLHNHTSASCIIPMQPEGYHQMTLGSSRAADIYEDLLTKYPDNLKYQWLYNVAMITLGKFPKQVPEPLLVNSEQLQAINQNSSKPYFEDIAPGLGVAVNELSGGVILEDFNGDHRLDIMASSWDLRNQLRFFTQVVKNGRIHFEEVTMEAGLQGITGGLNILQADYNNDGHKDVLVLRGAWLMENGKHPNSLLRNNGDGSFTDVTRSSGLLSYHPTQTAVWRDFNNDGWLDLFVGNEAITTTGTNSCELFINQKDGTFINQARQAGVLVNRFVKGVAAADYNLDGWQDLYISTLYGKNYLFENQGESSGQQLAFADVSESAGLAEHLGSFPCWFFDYNNDGWQDIFVNEFLFTVDQASGIIEQVAADYQGLPNKAATPHLYHNNGNGTFTEMTKPLNLNHAAYTMGCNFGDFNNDGWLDMYLGTGEPALSGIMPNRALLNLAGNGFQEITAIAGLGHIQKGHAVAFGDLDHDGDQDIYEVMGGAFSGDNYFNTLFENVYDSPQHPYWLKIKLEGTQSNRDGIGALLKIKILQDGEERLIHREMNTGGSFGSNPLRWEVGLDTAEKLSYVEVFWPVSQIRQRFENIRMNSFIKITEGVEEYEEIKLSALPFGSLNTDHPHHAVHQE